MNLNYFAEITMESHHQIITYSRWKRGYLAEEVKSFCTNVVGIKAGVSTGQTVKQTNLYIYTHALYIRVLIDIYLSEYTYKFGYSIIWVDYASLVFLNPSSIGPLKQVGPIPSLSS